MSIIKSAYSNEVSGVVEAITSYVVIGATINSVRGYYRFDPADPVSTLTLLLESSTAAIPGWDGEYLYVYKTNAGTQTSWLCRMGIDGGDLTELFDTEAATSHATCAQGKVLMSGSPRRLYDISTGDVVSVGSAGSGVPVICGLSEHYILAQGSFLTKRRWSDGGSDISQSISASVAWNDIANDDVYYFPETTTKPLWRRDSNLNNAVEILPNVRDSIFGSPVTGHLYTKDQSEDEFPFCQFDADGSNRVVLLTNVSTLHGGVVTDDLATLTP